MKNIKFNETKIKNIIKRGIALTAATFTLVSLSACSKKQNPENWPNEFKYINQEENQFYKYSKIIIRNGEPTNVFKGENISLTIDKETYEVVEYIYTKGTLSAQIYDLNTGYMVVDITAFDTGSYSKENWEIIKNDNYIIDFADIGDYVEGEKTKDYYTIDEIRELEPKIIESLKLLEEYNSSSKKLK